MNRIVLKIEREPLTGILRARVENDLEQFYSQAAAELRTDTAELMRPALRDGAKFLVRTHPKLKRNRSLKALANGL